MAVEGGYKNIEGIAIGELVWSWHEETGDLALKPVVPTMQRVSDALVQLRLGADEVQATPEHPFWANGGWKVAGELVVGDAVLRSDGLTMPVSEVVHHTEQATAVYNFEVGNWHTYLVSWWMFVVHNATVCFADLARAGVKFEQTNDVSLPEDYKDFLLNYNGGRPIPNIVSEVHSDVNWLYCIVEEPSWASLFHALDMYEGRIPAWYMPIGADSAGNLYTMSLDPENHGVIAIWWHEEETNANGSEYFDNLTAVADSFHEFLTLLTT